MVKFRNVRVKMKGGKSRIQRAMVMASGKLRFVKNISRSRSAAPRHKTTKHHSKGGIHMARGKKRHVSRGSIVGAVEKIGAVVCLVAPAAISLKERGFNEEGMKAILHKYSGINADAGRWEGRMLFQGWGPIVAFTASKIIAHKVMGMLRKL